MSFASDRNFWSACTYTRYDRLLKSKSFTYTEPINTCSASVTWLNGTCKLFAFSRSIFTSTCGSFAVKLVNSPLTFPLWFPVFTTWSAVSASVCSVFRPRSSSSNVKPPNCPSPCTAGGLKGITNPPGIAANGPRNFSTTSGPLCPGPLRSLKSARFRKTIPRFEAFPLKLNPTTVKAPVISGKCETAFSTFAHTSCVNGSKRKQCRRPMLHHAPHRVAIKRRPGIKCAIEQAEECSLCSFPVMPQENRGKRRCQCQCSNR